MYIFYINWITFYSCSIIIPLNDLPKPKGKHIIGTDIFNWNDSSRDEWFTKDEIDSRKIVWNSDSSKWALTDYSIRELNENGITYERKAI